MMTEKNSVLVGFMGAGKSVTALALAKRLGREHVSTDERIVSREGRSINAIFEESGEAYFRGVEREIVEELSRSCGLVIDCGGGVVINSGNVDALRHSGVIFYLKTSPDVIFARIRGQRHRPLMNVADPLQAIKNLLGQRAEYYARADYTVMTDGKTADETAAEIVGIFENHI